jgi:hypothetical protein
MWQSSAQLLDFLNENQGLLGFLSTLYALGGALAARQGFRYLGFAVLGAGFLGTLLVFGGFVALNNRVLSGFEGVNVLIPRELSKVRRDGALRDIAVDRYGKTAFACANVEKAFDPAGDNSVRLATRYEEKAPAVLLAANCPRVDESSREAQELYFAQFARVLAAREQRSADEIEIFDVAWTGDKLLDKGPTLGGCRFTWALKNSPDTFLDVYLAMPRPAESGAGRCAARKTFAAHLVLSAKRPNQLLLQTDYLLMWESVWSPLRAELAARNGGKPVRDRWSMEPEKPEPWPKAAPRAPVEPPVNAWPDPAIKIQGGHIADGPG